MTGGVGSAFGDDIDHAVERIGPVKGGRRPGNDFDAFHIVKGKPYGPAQRGVFRYIVVKYPVDVDQGPLIIADQSALVNQIRKDPVGVLKIKSRHIVQGIGQGAVSPFADLIFGNHVDGGRRLRAFDPGAGGGDDLDFHQLVNVHFHQFFKIPGRGVIMVCPGKRRQEKSGQDSQNSNATLGDGAAHQLDSRDGVNGQTADSDNILFFPAQPISEIVFFVKF